MPRKKHQKQLAVVDAHLCTGCQACKSVCPVQCISSADQACEVDQEHCIGCTLCSQICPFDSITMTPVDQVAEKAPR